MSCSHNWLATAAQRKPIDPEKTSTQTGKSWSIHPRIDQRLTQHDEGPAGTLQQLETHSSNMLYLGSVVGGHRAALPPVPLWRTPTPSPPMRKDRGLREAETKKDGQTFSDSRAAQKLFLRITVKTTALHGASSGHAWRVDLTSKLDRGLLTDDRAVLVGSQTAVLSYVLALNGVSNDQVASH